MTRRALVALCVALAALGMPIAAPANASITVLYTVEADTPNVDVAYVPGMWQRYELKHSNVSNRYALTVNTRPATRPAEMYIAVRGSGILHCRIRVQGAVVAVDNAPRMATCKA